MLDIVKGAVSQGLLWSIMAIGIYITYRILDISDLTSEGSFTLGAATLASLSVAGVHPLLALLMSMVAGGLAGLVTGLMHTKLKIPTLLAGILSMTGIYSVNLRIMGKANVSLNNQETILSLVAKWLGLSRERDAALIVGIFFALVVVVLLYLLLNTEFGYALRATGTNENMIRASGVNTNFTKVAGLVLGNALIALSGGLVCQYNGYADVAMGIGAIVIGLASVIIGEVFFGRSRIFLSLVGVVFGSIIYRIIVALVLRAGFPANDMRLFTAILVAIAISLPQIKANLQSFLASRKEEAE
ncbi:beta-methylgalactoside transporter inner membrane component [Clostridiales bacterium CHKCI006]|uniref:ABC transporter permease n=1 Tax=Candidatus Fimiplasma intestinipullorum TaxID=2840825 RepID=A0A9D1HPB0_9FIRM|nr:beta-methylgalactoside transporter inner membrane component [Clostridiales bacterium CHKCI006]HIU14327.1 ABC transporter permease [Candidatus Fimiplasma intestinipullorum]